MRWPPWDKSGVVGTDFTWKRFSARAIFSSARELVNILSGGEDLQGAGLPGSCKGDGGGQITIINIMIIIITITIITIITIIIITVACKGGGKGCSRSQGRAGWGWCCRRSKCTSWMFIRLVPRCSTNKSRIQAQWEVVQICKLKGCSQKENRLSEKVPRGGGGGGGADKIPFQYLLTNCANEFARGNAI